MTDIRPGTNTQAQFFNPKNEAMLDRLLYADFQRRTGGDLTEKQNQRLVKTVKHYMTEIYSKNPDQSIQFLNKEVLQSVVPDYMGYLKRNAGPTVAEEEDTSLRMDVNSRFGQLQNERQGPAVAQPVAPDFRISLDADGPTPVSRFEEIKRIREQEAAREAETAAAMAASRTTVSQEMVLSSRDTNMGRFVESDVDFRNGTEAARQRDQLSLIMREAERTVSRTEIVSSGRTLPDPRSVLLGEGGQMPPTSRTQGIASANPTLALTDAFRSRGPLPQDVIKPQDDIVSYKELEHNLYVYSADRDWVNNTIENRYNFSVTFDPANNQSGFGYNTATNIKFKNIVRIEFVKAIMPTESFDVLMTAAAGAPGVPVSGLNTNVLSFPYLQVRIPELNVNGYGTNDGINNAFAAISYDAYWTSDSNAGNKGFTRMIPKFLKCQKVYYPTPLSTLQKLTFQIQRPDGSYVSTTSDSMTISMVMMPNHLVSTTNYKSTYTSSTEGYEWLWLQTSTYFSQFMVSQGDRIIIKNIGFNSILAANPGFVDVVNYLTQPQGLLVSAIGVSTGASTDFTDGANVAGYANSIILRNSFQDPTTGATAVSTWVPKYIASVANFTAAASSTTITPSSGTVSLTLAAGLTFDTAQIPVFVYGATPANNFTGVVNAYNSTTGVATITGIANINGSFGSGAVYTVVGGMIPSTGRLINMNHQIQIIMRVITREMDAASKLRPDNLQA
jgi:hypothetical protein